MVYVKSISLDFNAENKPLVIGAKQNDIDSRFIVITPTADGKQIDMTDIIALRTWKFIVVSNEKSICAMFGNYNSTMPESPKFSIVRLFDEDFSAAAFATGSNVLSGEFYRTDSGNENAVIKFDDRLNYEVDNGNVEFIKNKVLLDKDKTVKIKDFSGLYDCSTVAEFSFLSIDNDSYYAIDNHTLMKINQEAV